ncbi:hypothetical protein RJ641_035752 [Dillenia turbinata]|uniref:Uncharacterized protein n=1 Tax=Dillenia turbinata TaxID=194707 RepID=A0AAN8ZF88_9MAGN
MCRSTEIRGLYRNQRDRLKIKAFSLKLSISIATKPLPETLTLLFLPRINGTPLEINDSNIRSDSPAFISLHRVVSAKTRNGDVLYGSRERVRVCEGARFEVYLNEEKVLKGIFRKDEDEEWKVECECVLEREMIGVSVSEAEISVGVEGHVALNESVEVVVKRRKKKGRSFLGLEEIPEEREVMEESEPEAGCRCCFSREEGEMGSDGGDCLVEESEDDDPDEKEEEEIKMEMEGVRWAVDVGIWVMCLGVGYLVSRASSKRQRRRWMF